MTVDNHRMHLSRACERLGNGLFNSPGMVIAGVHLLKLFELCGLIDHSTTILSPPAVVDLLGNTKLLGELLRSTFPGRGPPRLPEACEYPPRLDHLFLA
ncbi:MAG: hypothetical protein VYA84_17870 [Planctomycetota bacterium]|nr:hypothetical protein [Planctomycetota bacterium]